MCGVTPGSGTVRGGTPMPLGKKKAWADEVRIAPPSTAKQARYAHLPMKDAFPIGGLLSFLAIDRPEVYSGEYSRSVKPPILA